jgi:hypothetical protein
MAAPLVFSVAQNGAGMGWWSCLRSQAAYAARLGYAYQAVLRPLRVEPALSAWLKIPLMLRALRAGCDWVAFLDADCKVSWLAPDFRAVEVAGRSVYRANGNFGRLDSGVLFARRDPASIDFFEQAMARLSQDPTDPVEVAGCELDPVSACTRDRCEAAPGDARWNHGDLRGLDPYFRRDSGALSGARRALVSRLELAVRSRAVSANGTGASFGERLSALAETCWRLYPLLSRAEDTTGANYARACA